MCSSDLKQTNADENITCLAEVTKLDPKHLSHNFTFTSIEMKKLMYTSGCRAGRTATQQPGCQTRVSATEAPTRYGAVERSQDAP